MPQRQRRALLALLPLLPLAWQVAGAAEPAAPGRFAHHARFRSRHVAARDIRVWLPPDHDEGERCAVLYMHDGQNLFAPANPFDNGPWDVDRHLLALRAEARVRKTMVVGIDNAGVDRAREYGPQRAIERLPRALRDRLGNPPGAASLAEAYLRFLVEELKPFIDRQYRTRPQREHTVVMGSSMGGLVSVYALSRYPEVFGAAGALSTHWPVTVDHKLLQPKLAPEVEAIASAHLDWLRKHLPRAGRHRLYFDHGDQTLDALYEVFQRRMDAIAAEKGYREGVDYRSSSFPGASHDERAWRHRLAEPLSFLLPPEG